MSLVYQKDQYIHVNGVNVRCWRTGTQGTPILLIHGIGAAIEYWAATMESLGQNHRVLAIDLPGFGKSDKPKVNYTLEYYAKFIAQLIEQEQFGQCHVVAHSLGGGLALYLAITWPHLIKKLVLIDNVGFARQVDIFFRLLTVPGVSRLFSNISESVFAQALRHHVYDPESLPQHFLDRMYPLSVSPANQNTTMQILRDNITLLGVKPKALKPIWDNIKIIESIPTLVFWGKEDSVLKYKPHTDGMRKLLPHAELISIDQCGHIPQIEHSNLVNQKILHFLSDKK